MSIDNEWITIEEAAARLRIKPITVRSLMARGELVRRKSRFGGYMLCRDSVELYRLERSGRVGRPRKAQ